MKNSKEQTDKITELEKLAEIVLDLKKEVIPRRPLVIEFCGSPKSGKSSCINSLDLFLRRNKFRTKILTERASVCPVNDKYDPFFNIWTLCSAIAQLSETLANDAKKYDIVILDRGIFDALCWFTWLLRNNYLDGQEYESLGVFGTMPKWRRVIDLIYVFTATPKVSMEREYAYLLTRKMGSIMQPKVLNSYTDAIDETIKKFGGLFRKVQKYDTSDLNQNAVSYGVTKDILNILREVTEEKIGFIEKSQIEHIGRSSFSFEEINGDETPEIKFGLRADVEDAEDKIQLIPILVITNLDHSQILVGKKRSNQNNSSQSHPEKDKLLLYFGGHVREEDSTCHSSKNFIYVIKTALNREIKEETGIDHCPENNNPLCIWIRKNTRSRKHLALCFIYEKDFDFLKFNLDKNEFQSGSSKSGVIMSAKEIYKEYDNVEEWGKTILSAFFEDQDFRQKELHLLDP